MTLSNFKALSNLKAVSKLNQLSFYSSSAAFISSLIAVSIVSILTLGAMSLSTASQAGYDYTASTATRVMAANPNHFKPISVNGRAVAVAVEPCLVSTGLIACTLDKLALINGSAASIHDDYDQVQVYFYPDSEQPKTAVVIAQKTGLMDDSVGGERYRVSFKLSGGTSSSAKWNLVQYGAQYLCSRGDAAGMWVQSGCS